jgi:hypothetical protein
VTSVFIRHPAEWWIPVVVGGTFSAKEVALQLSF